MCGAVTVACAGVSVFSRPCDCSGASPTVAGEPKTQLKKTLSDTSTAAVTGDVGSSENFIVGEGILKNVSTPNMRILPTSIPTFFCCCVFYICSVVQVTISGVVKVVSSEVEGGGARNKNKCLFLLYIDANSIHNSKTHSGDKSDSLQFTHKDLLAINEIAHEPDVFKLVVNSICPSIYGNEVEHTALSLSRARARVLLLI